MMSLWDVDRNDNSPKSIVQGSSVKYWWKCSKGCGNHRWQASAYHIKNGSRCPICIGKTICPCKCNALSTQLPYINSIWSQNNSFLPNEVTRFSNRLAEFVCEKHGTWSTIINVIGGQGCGCPQYGIIKRANAQRMTNDVFISKCKLIWGDRFLYNDTFYHNYHGKVTVTCKDHGIFQSTPATLLDSKTLKACPKCAHNTYSAKSIKWLELMSVIYKCNIRHAENQGEELIWIGGKRYKCDGFCPETNTVFEFYGNYWHGNPKIFQSNFINKTTGITMGILYANTIEREKQIMLEGFNIKVIWESEWDKFNKVLKKIQRIWKSTRTTNM